MNIKEAQKEVEKRWGECARAWILCGIRYVSRNTQSPLGDHWNHFDGQGKSWEEAIARAEEKSEDF